MSTEDKLVTHYRVPVRKSPMIVKLDFLVTVFVNGEPDRFLRNGKESEDGPESDVQYDIDEKIFMEVETEPLYLDTHWVWLAPTGELLYEPYSMSELPKSPVVIGVTKHISQLPNLQEIEKGIARIETEVRQLPTVAADVDRLKEQMEGLEVEARERRRSESDIERERRIGKKLRGGYE